MELREKIEFILEDKDAHFPSNWKTTNRILKAFKEWIHKHGNHYQIELIDKEIQGE